MYKLALFLSLFFVAGIEAYDVYSSSMHLAAAQVAAAQAQGPEANFSPQESVFYHKLPSDKKRAFLAMTEDERGYALDMTVKVAPAVALNKAIDYEVQSFDTEQQALYRRLSDKDRAIFFLISEDASRQAVEWAKRVTADQAVEQALQIDLDTFIPEQLNFYQQLTPENQLIYLALSTRTQENLALDTEAKKDPNKAVAAAQERDAARFSMEQYAYYKSLNDKDRAIFLSLTPDARGMAVSLVEGIDPSDAVSYIVALRK